MLPTMAQFTAQVNAAVAEQVDWAKQEFGFGNLPLKIKIVDVETGALGMARVIKRKGAFAGFEIKIQAYHFLRDKHIAVTEYATYNAWPEIGGFETEDWRLGVDALVAHELAHVIQFAYKYAGAAHPHANGLNGNGKMTFGFLGAYEKGHSYFFRQIYKRFRQRWINDHVSDSAYTNPTAPFVFEDTMAKKIEEKTDDNHPLKGIKFQFKNKTYEVAGRNPRAAKLFGYMVKTPTGSFAKIKLSLIIKQSPEAERIVLSNPALRAELEGLIAAQAVKRQANEKSSHTKRRRVKFERAAAAAHY